MKAKGIFISTLLVIDTFLMSYAAGFHSKHVLVVNPKLPPVVQKKVEAKPVAAAAPTSKEVKTHEAKPPSKASAAGKNATKAKANSTSAAKPAVKKEDKKKPASKPAAKPAKKSAPKPSTNSPGA